MIKDINNETIQKNISFNNLFLSATLNEINQNCKILSSDFYSDSFNYFPITFNYETFKVLFKKQDNNSIDHFYSDSFFENFKKNKDNFREFDNCFVLGSSPADNFFSNLIHFLPRIFFTNEKKINLAIHRNLSNKFRNLIKFICDMREVEIKYNYLDDEFCKFNNSSIPQFFAIQKSIAILKFFFSTVLKNMKDIDFGKKIYVRREDTNYRKILNEADLIEKLRKNGFEVINPNHFEILDQMKIFSKAEIIISAHGSNLSNIVFCNQDTKVYEISPKFTNSYEKNFENRYKKLAVLSNLKYEKIFSDVVDIKKHSDIAKKYISSDILNESNYYKNLILKISDIDQLISNL